MKTMIIIAITLAGSLALAACHKAVDAPPKPAVASAEMGSAGKTGAGSGKITGLDKAAGNITIAHGPIPGVGWPAMTMGFKADPKILAGVSVSDQIDFTLSLKGNDGTVTAIARK